LGDMLTMKLPNGASIYAHDGVIGCGECVVHSNVLGFDVQGPGLGKKAGRLIVEYAPPTSVQACLSRPSLWGCRVHRLVGGRLPRLTSRGTSQAWIKIPALPCGGTSTIRVFLREPDGSSSSVRRWKIVLGCGD
jgi:hypothetical protein